MIPFRALVAAAAAVEAHSINLKQFKKRPGKIAGRFFCTQGFNAQIIPLIMWSQSYGNLYVSSARTKAIKMSHWLLALKVKLFPVSSFGW